MTSNSTDNLFHPSTRIYCDSDHLDIMINWMREHPKGQAVVFITLFSSCTDPAKVINDLAYKEGKSFFNMACKRLLLGVLLERKQNYINNVDYSDAIMVKAITE